MSKISTKNILKKIFKGKTNKKVKKKVSKKKVVKAKKAKKAKKIISKKIKKVVKKVSPKLTKTKKAIKITETTAEPKVDSSLLIFHPKKKFIKIKDPKNLETITRIFFNQRRKMLKKPFNQLFNGDHRVLEKLNIDLNLRPQNLNLETYYRLASEYEKLRS